MDLLDLLIIVLLVIVIIAVFVYRICKDRTYNDTLEADDILNVDEDNVEGFDNPPPIDDLSVDDPESVINSFKNKTGNSDQENQQLPNQLKEFDFTLHTHYRDIYDPKALKVFDEMIVKNDDLLKGYRPEQISNAETVYSQFWTVLDPNKQFKTFILVYLLNGFDPSKTSIVSFEDQILAEVRRGSFKNQILLIAVSRKLAREFSIKKHGSKKSSYDLEDAITRGFNPRYENLVEFKKKNIVAFELNRQNDEALDNATIETLDAGDPEDLAIKEDIYKALVQDKTSHQKFTTQRMILEDQARQKGGLYAKTIEQNLIGRIYNPILTTNENNSIGYYLQPKGLEEKIRETEAIDSMFL